MSTRAEPGNRIFTVCSCGNEFTVSPNQHGEYVYCLECNEATLAVEPEERQQLEERREPSLEQHVLATALWLTVLGLFLGMAGMSTVVARSPSSLLPSFGLGSTPEGLLLMVLGGGVLYVSLKLQKHVSWAWLVCLIFSSLATLSILTGLVFRFLIFQPAVAGMLAVSILATVILIPEDVRKLFTDEYREVLNAFRRPISGCLKSYVFWIPFIVMTVASLF